MSAFLFALLAAPASADTSDCGELIRKAGTLGYRVVSMDRGSLRTGQAMRYTDLTLRAGTDYAFLACSNDGRARDIDLRVIVNGVVVDEDVARDDYPVVEYAPARSTKADVQVGMHKARGASSYTLVMLTR